MARNSPAHDVQASADKAAAEGRKAAEATRDTMQRARAGAARTLSDVQDIAHDAADARVRNATGAAAETAERSAQSAHDAASGYPDGSIAQDALSRVSGLLENTAAGLRDTDLERVTTEVQRFAQRNPMLFLAGAAAVGFTAARLLRAGDRDGEDWKGDEFDDLHGVDPREDWDRSAPAPKGRAEPRDERTGQIAPVGPAVDGRHA